MVKLKNCKLISKKTAIEISGNGRVELVNCRIEAKNAFVMEGNGYISAKDSVIKGKISKEGNAVFKNISGNKVE